MGIVEKIKDAIWGTSDLTPTPETDPVEEAYLGTQQAGTGFTPELETGSADDDASIPSPRSADPTSNPHSADPSSDR